MRTADISPLARVMHRVDAVADGAPAVDTVATGFPSVDRVLGGGIRRGDLVVVGGDVGSGKSAFLLAVALRMAAGGSGVALFSGEMTIDRLLERALAVEGRVSVHAMRLGELDDQQRASVGAAAVRLRNATPWLGTLPRGGVAALREELLRLPLPPTVVVVDPLAALGAAGRPDPEGLAAVVLGLKQLALELEVGVLLSAPVPGVTREREDRRPTLDDFGAAGAIKDAADVVLTLYREGMYDRGLGIDGATELLVRKQRNGATGYVDLYFFEQWMRFEDLLDPDR